MKRYTLTDKGVPPARALGLFALICLLATRPAHAQSSPRSDEKAEAQPATAQALYERAAALYEAGDRTEACPLFAKSYQIGPDTGTLLALATCHQEQGKNASAADEFAAGKARAHAEGNVAREKYADEALRSLPPVSTVQIDVSPAIAALPDFVLSIDGEMLPKADWNRPIPFDGGRHVIEAHAARGEPWRREFTLAPDLGNFRDSVELVIEPAPRQARAAVAVEALPHEPEPSGWSTLETSGVVVAGVGVASFAFAVYFFAEQQRLQDSDVAAARENGRRVDVAIIVGGVLAATGITLFLVGRSQRLSAPSASQISLSVGFPSDGGWALAVQGTL